jgi:hypothetical protein
MPSKPDSVNRGIERRIDELIEAARATMRRTEELIEQLRRLRSEITERRAEHADPIPRRKRKS